MIVVDTNVIGYLYLSSERSVYNCEFVALAEDLRVRLVTVDRQILEQFPGVAMSLEAFVSLTDCH